jgi:acyl-CoA thioesterase-2
MTALDRVLALEDQGDDVYIAPGRAGHRHLFGGLVVAHALRAAGLTVEGGHPAHALHAHFLRAGRGDEPVAFAVERTRTGASFVARRVVARQRSHVLFVLSASFHDDEPGPAYEPPPAQGVPGPEGLGPGRYESELFECRDVPPSQEHHVRRMWFRAREAMPDDPALHQEALAMASDHGPTRATRQPHLHLAGVERRMSVSLDHSVWFHRQARVDEWLLSEFTPVWTGAGRGLALGSIRTITGRLVATATQETLLRIPE